MKKNIKPKIKKKNLILEKINAPDFKYCALTLLVVFFVYSFSLFRPWQPFDERAFYDNVLFPIPNRFNEIFEVIKVFVLHSHIVSMNYFFSNHATLRSDPTAWTMLVFIFYFFKKSAFLYHLFQLSIHLINTLLVWLIFRAVEAGLKPVSTAPTKYFLISLFTAIWALHSANSEAVLLVTNWNANLTYTFCLGFILREVRSGFSAKGGSASTMIIAILFFFTTLITEYSYTFPLVIFFIALSYKKSFSSSLKLCMPYLIGLTIFLLYSLLKPSSPLNQIIRIHHDSSLYVLIERNLWLTPQLFVHFFKLFFFPMNLSTYQSNLVHMANTLIEPYSIFCTLFYLSFLILPVILFIIFKKHPFGFVFPLFYAFYFSLFPFLHIILPTYCLSADRYCYFPSFFLLFLFFHLFHLATNFSAKENPKILKSIAITFSLILLIISLRTLVRIKDWYDPSKLYQSAISLDKNPLYKAYKLSIYGDFIGKQGNEQGKKEYIDKALSESYKALELFKQYKENHTHQPVTLKLYGLDFNALIFKSVFLIATIKNDYLKESPKEILTFFEPYIKNNLTSINPITLYAKILLRDGQIEKAKEVLEDGLKTFPYSADIVLSLLNFYLNENDLEKACKLLEIGYKYFPNNPLILEKYLNYYEKKNDRLNEARLAYLLGLRMQEQKGYQKAANIYLDLNQFDQANISLKKAIRLNPADPLTLLFISRYLDLTGKRSKILPILNSAYLSSKTLGDKQDIKVTKSILASLINVYSQAGDTDTAIKLLIEFENTRNLTNEDKRLILELKNRLRLSK